MTREEIDQLLLPGGGLTSCSHPELVETHISWVILCDEYAYKIKKPMLYSFLDFSTAARRKHFCDREVALNRRLAPEIYLDVLPIVRDHTGIHLDGVWGEDVIDHAVRMRRLDNSKQMDVLVAKGVVAEGDVVRLAEVIADFHRKARVIYDSDIRSIQDKFNALEEESDFLQAEGGSELRDRIQASIRKFDQFMDANSDLLEKRLKEGFFRDVHGDLHTRNIFLLPAPVIFDCIEFNDEYRQIDVLNEVAFLCMDLEAGGRADLSDRFINTYNRLFTSMRNEAEERLFRYYKSYRANVRAKVNSLRARSANTEEQSAKALSECHKYLRLMEGYLA